MSLLRFMSWRRGKKTPRFFRSLPLVFCLLLLAGCGTFGGNSTANTVPDSALPTPIVGKSQNVSLTTIHMFSNTEGWAITTTHHLLFTSDGVGSWHDVTPGLSRDTYVFGPAYFLNAQTAWVVAQSSQGLFSVFYTVNSGALWDETPLVDTGSSVTSLYFSDSQNGWLLFDKKATDTSDSVDIFRTLDGGADWAVVANSQATVGADGGIANSGLKSGLAFQSFAHGWLTGSVSVTKGASFYLTTDGGYTWNTQALSLPVDQNVDSETTYPPTFFGSNDGIMPVSLVVGKQNLLAIATTHNGGSSWVVSSPSDVASSNLVFIDALHGWSIGSGSATNQIYATSDGGASWKLMATLPTSDGHALSLNFVSATNGWAIVLNAEEHLQLLQTTDGGKSWITINPTAVS